MYPILGLLLLDALPWLDQRFRKSVSKLIPDFERLQSNPKEYFESNEIRIGPGLRIASSVLFGFLLNVAVFVFAAVFIAAGDVPAVKGTVGYAILRSLTSLFSPIVFGLALVFFLRGGALKLSKDGALLTHRRKTVFCPWELFNAIGIPAKLDGRTVAIPVNPSAIAEVKLQIEDRLIGNGRDVRTKQFRFRLDSSPRVTNSRWQPEAALRDNYYLKITDVASLLLAIGRRMSIQETTPAIDAIPEK